MEERRQKRRAFLGSEPEVTRSGLVDTSVGLLLTSEEALKLAQEKHLSDSLKIAAKQRKEAETALMEAEVVETTRLDRLRHEANASDLRIKWYGLPNTQPRPLAIRRRISTERKAQRRKQDIKKAMKSFVGDRVSHADFLFSDTYFVLTNKTVVQVSGDIGLGIDEASAPTCLDILRQLLSIIKKATPSWMVRAICFLMAKTTESDNSKFNFGLPSQFRSSLVKPYLYFYIYPEVVSAISIHARLLPVDKEAGDELVIQFGVRMERPIMPPTFHWSVSCSALYATAGQLSYPARKSREAPPRVPQVHVDTLSPSQTAPMDTCNPAAVRKGL